MSLPQGVRLALDWGDRRIGVAACDAGGTIAYPVATVDAEDPWDRIAALVAEYEPVAVVVGYPLDLRGEPGPAAVKMESRAEDLAGRLDIPVWLADERLSTGEAARKLHLAGRNARQQRGIVDQAAAVAILEGVLAAERAGHLPGHPAAAVTKEDS